MRIIVTKNGQTIIQEMENDKNILLNEDNLSKKKRNRYFSGLKLPYLHKKFTNIKEFYENNKKLKWGQNHRTKSVLSKRTLDNYFNRDESKINIKELEQAKRIQISKPKINLSQQFLNKYDDLDLTFKDKINNLTNTLKSAIDKNNEKSIKNEISEQKKIFNNMKININKSNEELNTNNININNNERFNKNKILLGEIISKNNLIKLKSQLSKDNLGYNDTRLPLDNKNIDSFNFRSKYEDKKATIDNLAIILNIPLNPDRINLIKYFKQNKDISPFYFENLLKYDESQIYKLNKICQIIFHKKENELKEQKLIEDKKFNKEKIIREKGNKNMNRVNNIMNITNGIISGYNLKQEIKAIKKKKIFKEQIKKMKNKYWDKYGVNKFYKENQIKEQNYLSTTDFEEIQNKEQKKKLLFASRSTPDILSLNN